MDLTRLWSGGVVVGGGAASAFSKVLAGFSQGGALSLYTGLRLPIRLAGVVCISAARFWGGSLFGVGF